MNWHTCPICERTFGSFPEMRRDVTGKFWCKSCSDEHDAIDWGERADRRMEEGWN